MLPGHKHHFFGHQLLSCKVTCVGRTAQSTEDEVHIACAQLGGQQVERAFVGNHLDMGVGGHQAHDGRRQDSRAAQGQGAHMHCALQLALKG
ncbi:hypothetical protein D3C81_1577120 [compost metagenome]